MKTLDILGRLIQGDFRERTRRYSYFLILLFTLFFGYLVLTGKFVIRFGEFRGAYYSAWEGTLMAIAGTMIMILFGFYLVKNSIGRDQKAGTGQIIGVSNLGNLQYLLAKFISNFLVLASIMALLAVMVTVVVLIKGRANLWSLLSPFLIISLPVMALLGALALFFECVRWLRGSAGNIIYLIIAESVILYGAFHTSVLDISCLSLFQQSAYEAVAKIYGPVEPSLAAGFINLAEENAVRQFKIIPWDGIHWSWEMILGRFALIGLAIVIVWLALPFFDRFDPARSKIRQRKRKSDAAINEIGTEIKIVPIYIGIGQVSPPKMKFSFFQMIAAELRLMLKGYHWIFYLIALALIVAQAAAPFDVVRKFIVPGAMIWPLLIWSSMGTREARFNTGPLLFSASRPLIRQLPATLTAGILVALLSISGIVVRAGLAGEGLYLAALLAGAIFVPSASFALGVASGSKKVFEVTYLMFWYIGSINQVEVFDFLGTTAGAISMNNPAIYPIIALILILFSFMVRYHRLKT